ncbi:MAG: uracil-DNA glycosylase [Proteobacteria bacterium]|nr:uracil-DNA glycosylase [Pseudomonadota bacterium]
MTQSRFLRALQQDTPRNVFNPWRDFDPTTDLSRSAPQDRLSRLASHLDCKPQFILIGEAAGYQGCKVSGIPFTSERLINAGDIPRIACDSRLTSRQRPWSEPSATTVWGALHELGLAGHTVLWNAYPWHPHKEGSLHSNRTPTPAERAAGVPVLRLYLGLFPKACVFAVGRNAEAALAVLEIPAKPLRHPSMGGAAKFRQQLSSFTRSAS